MARFRRQSCDESEGARCRQTPDIMLKHLADDAKLVNSMLAPRLPIWPKEWSAGRRARKDRGQLCLGRHARVTWTDLASALMAMVRRAIRLPRGRPLTIEFAGEMAAGKGNQWLHGQAARAG